MDGGSKVTGTDQPLIEMTAERDQLAEIIGVLLGVVTPAQFAEVRQVLAERDLDFPW